MITKEVYELLNKQINAELWSAYLYLSMSLDAEHKGYCGVAHWFLLQSEEELNHSRILQRYLVSRNCKVELLPIDEVPGCWMSPLQMFEEALNQETQVTDMIHEIVALAERYQDYATMSKMIWFIDEQIEEESSCSSIVQQYRNAKDNVCAMILLDKELLGRKQHPK